MSLDSPILVTGAAVRRLLATCHAAEPLRAGAAGAWRPGARGVSALRRAPQQGVWRWACGQTPAAAGGWPGGRGREHGTGWVHAAGGKSRLKFLYSPLYLFALTWDPLKPRMLLAR